MSHEEIYNNFKEALFNASEEVKKDVMELKVGNIVLVKHTAPSGIIFEHDIIITAISNKGGAIYGFAKGYYKQQYFSKDIIKIIGRPITLEDVLRALEKKDYNILPSGEGYVDIVKPLEDGYRFITDWLLGKPASEQSDETLIKMTELLK